MVKGHAKRAQSNKTLVRKSLRRRNVDSFYCTGALGVKGSISDSGDFHANALLSAFSFPDLVDSITTTKTTVFSTTTAAVQSQRSSLVNLLSRAKIPNSIAPSAPSNWLLLVRIPERDGTVRACTLNYLKFLLEGNYEPT